MSIDPISAASPVAASAVDAVAAPPPAPGTTDFSTVLQRYLDPPKRDISSIRAEIASIRAGTPLWGGARGGSEGSRPDVATGSAAAALLNDFGFQGIGSYGLSTGKDYVLPPRTGSASDPYGWRQTSRDLAERIIGPGYGDLFERQIDQESGFIPDVVFGKRVSSAGAEGIAQLMPQYYPHVDRSDPVAGLTAGAETMRHYLTVWDGDVRKALASYNAGLGRVQSLVNAHGANWEAGLPQETRSYLASILGGARPRYEGAPTAGSDVFGGRGPGGVLSMPVGGVTGRRSTDTALELFAAAGAEVRAPSDGVVLEAGAGRVVIDHGNGWRSALEGLDVAASVGASVRRSDTLGALDGGGLLRMSVTQGGRALDPSRYVLDT